MANQIQDRNIGCSSSMALSQPSSRADAVSGHELDLEAALKLYAQRLASQSEKTLKGAQKDQLNTHCETLRTRSSSVSDQTTAFRQVRLAVEEMTGADVAPDLDLELRNSVRDEVALSWFALAGSNDRLSNEPKAPKQPTNDRLLDVEIIAIYW